MCKLLWVVVMETSVYWTHLEELTSECNFGCIQLTRLCSLWMSYPGVASQRLKTLASKSVSGRNVALKKVCINTHIDV